MFSYILLLINLGFFVILFFIFRRYIKHELGKTQYVRHVEQELRQLLIDVNRSAEDISQVIEDRTEQLRTLLTQGQNLLQELKPTQEQFWQQNNNWEQKYLRLRELEQDTEKTVKTFQQQLDDIQEQAGQALRTQIEKKLQKDLSQKLEYECIQLQKKLEQASSEAEKQSIENLQKATREAIEIAIQTLESHTNQMQADLAKEETPTIEGRILDDQMRADVERYIALGLDARIISQKTGVALNLIEIMVSMKNLT